MRSTRVLLASLATVALAACGGGGDEGAADDTAALGAVEGVFQITGTDQLKYSATSLTSDTTDITFELTCESAAEHNVVIEETGDEVVAECAPGETGTGSTTLEAGDYTFYCSIPGHRAAGMEGTLTVAPA